MVESGRVPGKGSIRRSIEKTVSANTDMGSNQCEYQKMVESGRVPGKGRILTSIEKTVSAHTEKVSNECEYRKMEETVRVSKNCLDEYRKSLQSV